MPAVNITHRLRANAAPLCLLALALLGFARIFMLRDVYADDNCWLFGIYQGRDLHGFLDTGFYEMRREGLGVFFYLFYLPFRWMDNPYVVWHGTVLALQLGAPLVLYALVRRLSGDEWRGFFVAVALVVVPLDHVAPYLSGINYRFGLFLGLLSLYLTDRYAQSGSRRAFIGALLCMLPAEYVFIEATVGFESARALLLWYRFRTIRAIARAWWPFLILGLPLVALKLFFRPYGIYSTTYPTGFGLFFDGETLPRLLDMFLFAGWNMLRRFTQYGQLASLVLAFLAAAVLVAYLMQTSRDAGARRGASTPFFVLLGLAIVLPQIVIFFYAHRPPSLGTESTHAALMQPGHALVLGSLVYSVVAWTHSRGLIHRVAIYLLALFIGIGTFYNNLNLDLFASSSLAEQRFWHAFRTRFPSLPAQADFVIDAEPAPYRRQHRYFNLEDIYGNYELEFGINREYRSRDAGNPRRYRVYPFDELMTEYRIHGEALFAKPNIGRHTHYGVESLDPGELTVVHYRDGRILVNREILQRYPKVVYRAWADKDLPGWMKR